MMTPMVATAAKMNQFGRKGIPFLFIIDFEMNKPLIYPLDTLPSGISFSTPLFPHDPITKQSGRKVELIKEPIPFERYLESFNIVMKHLERGDSYLLNLTFPTAVRMDLTLKEVFEHSTAPYRLLYEDQFVIFSPESFLLIRDGEIISRPMKGTIDASHPDAETDILEDPKEIAEHHTIVDLIRNDLSMISTEVYVSKFRYIDRIRTHEKEILQVSSEIKGRLPANYSSQIGDIIFSVLPAGSICGAPKNKTVDIIRSVEQGKRGYYSGIFGIFDGIQLDSAVMIRYIESTDSAYLFRSGGGITHRSDPRKEYQEMIDKVYVSFY